jgi:flagellar hook-associated protein 3 FlgL
MSGSVTGMGASDYGMMSSLISNIDSIKQTLDQLTSQASSGYVSNTYAGLGAGAAVSLDLSPQVASLQTWQNNIDAASGSMQVTQTAMTQIQQIASNLLTQVDSLSSEGTTSIAAAAASANSALAQLGSLLDTQDGNTYVFAGKDSANPPVPDPDNITSTGFYSQINAAVAALTTNGAAATAATTLIDAKSAASSPVPGDSPYSFSMSQLAGTVGTATAAAAVQAMVPVAQVGQNSTVSTGLLASANVSAVSGGGSTTGSYMTDLMRALATVGSLGGAQASTADLNALLQDTRTSLTGVITAMATDTAALGNTQSQLTATQTGLSDVQTALTGQVSSAQDTNMAATLSSLTQVQTQLQASYQVIASLSGLSLAKFLPAG